MNYENKEKHNYLLPHNTDFKQEIRTANMYRALCLVMAEHQINKSHLLYFHRRRDHHKALIINENY